MSFTIGLGFLDSQVKHLPVFLKGLFKICVVDRKPKTAILFFPIYTKLYYRNRGLNDKFNQKLYEC